VICPPVITLDFTEV